MTDRTDESDSEPTATDTPGENTDAGSDTTPSYPDEGQSSFARWNRRAIRARLDPRQTALPEWVGEDSTPVGGSTLANRAVRTVLSPRVVVALGLAVDLSLRTLVDVGPILVTVVELLAPVVSLSAGTVTPAAIGRATTWLVLLGVLYAVAPRLFPRAVRPELDRIGFRLLFAGLAGVYGLLLGIDAGPVRFTATAAVGMIGGVVVTTAYFWWRPDWDLLDPAGEGTELLDAIARADMVADRRADQERSGVLGKLADTFAVVAVALLVCLPALAAGILAIGFVDVQPLPDLLAVSVLASGLLGLGSRSPRFVTLDLEERVLSSVREATRTLKGAILSLLLAVAAALTAILFSVVLGNTPDFARLAVEAVVAGRAGTPGVFGTAWVAVGTVCSFSTGAIHLLWVFARVFRRLPAFLVAWRDAEEVPAVPVARPPGWIVPGFLALAVGGGCLFLLSARPLPLVGWLWPLGVVPALIAPLIARRRDATVGPEVPETENRYLALTVSSQPVLLVVGTWVFARVAAGEPLVLGALDGTVGVLIAMSTALPALVYFPDAARYADRHEGVERYAHAAYLAVFGLWLVGIGAGFDLSLAAVLRVFGGVTVVGAVVLCVAVFVEPG